MEENEEVKKKVDEISEEFKVVKEGENKTDNSDTKETKIQYIIILFVIILLVILGVNLTDYFIIQEYSGEYSIQYGTHMISNDDDEVLSGNAWYGGIFDYNEYLQICYESGLKINYSDENLDYIIFSYVSIDSYVELIDINYKDGNLTIYIHDCYTNTGGDVNIDDTMLCTIVIPMEVSADEIADFEVENVLSLNERIANVVEEDYLIIGAVVIILCIIYSIAAVIKKKRKFCKDSSINYYFDSFYLWILLCISTSDRRIETNYISIPRRRDRSYS